MIENIDEISRLLKSTGLSQKQKDAYAVLLRHGESTISEIADGADLKRPNTYVVMDELVKLGYARKKIDSKRKLYSATDPSRILSDIKLNLKNLEEMLPYLHALQKRNGKPYVQYFEGEEGARQAFSQIYKPKEARYAVSTESAKRAIPKEIERWQKMYFLGKTRPGGKHLVKTEGANKYVVALKKGKQETRFLPGDLPFEMDIALVDGAVYLAGFDDLINITVIHSQAVYDVFCSVYDVLWENLATSTD